MRYKGGRHGGRPLQHFALVWSGRYTGQHGGRLAQHFVVRYEVAAVRDGPRAIPYPITNPIRKRRQKNAAVRDGPRAVPYSMRLARE